MARALLAILVVAAAGCGAGSSSPDPTLDRQLIEAAFANDVERAADLIDRGANVNTKDETQQSAYLIATSEVGDDPRLLELTLDNDAKVNDKDRFDGTGLIRAAERGHARIVRRLLQTDIEEDHVNRLGWTALHEAIVLGEGGRRHTATVEVLVAGGVDVNVPDGDGVTALAHAEERGYEEIARILRAAGAKRTLGEEGTPETR
ncbi:MAG: ankyrin repeat domain-containing protein [Actinomycetota bacterium]|nr:ankyrin repeat domain-containing protein [Actinomycetota bacterium]